MFAAIIDGDHDVRAMQCLRMKDTILVYTGVAKLAALIFH